MLIQINGKMVLYQN